MAYSDKVIDHYENPRNVGSFGKDEPGVGTGMVGAPACGDVMKLQIKVDRCIQVLYKMQNLKLTGVVVLLLVLVLSPSGSRARTWMRHKPLRTPILLVELALPPVKIHCSILAEDAIKAAVNDYRNRNSN
jgi:nitrogen fixation protein NifU and related proteins